LQHPYRRRTAGEITVLFADLTSFTELTHDLGAERTHEVIDAFLRMATEALVKHGAFIDKYIGDALMALFNVPIRHEDHAALFSRPQNWDPCFKA
jgi:adenylate cyclase